MTIASAIQNFIKNTEMEYKNQRHLIHTVWDELESLDDKCWFSSNDLLSWITL